MEQLLAVDPALIEAFDDSGRTMMQPLLVMNTPLLARKPDLIVQARYIMQLLVVKQMSNTTVDS